MSDQTVKVKMYRRHGDQYMSIVWNDGVRRVWQLGAPAAVTKKAGPEFLIDNTDGLWSVVRQVKP